MAYEARTSTAPPIEAPPSMTLRVSRPGTPGPGDVPKPRWPIKSLEGSAPKSFRAIETYQAPCDTATTQGLQRAKTGRTLQPHYAGTLLKNIHDETHLILQLYQERGTMILAIIGDADKDHYIQYVYSYKILT